MKSVALALLLLVASTVNAEPSRKAYESTPIPTEGFEDLAELETWANSTSFGGGMSGTLTIAGRKIYFTDRMFTSGRATSELAFYSDWTNGKIRPFLIIPLQLKEFRIAVEDDEIVTRSYDPESRDWPIALRISVALLPREQSKTEQGAAANP